ncbi:MAG: hypothetical protein AB7L66_22745 [Gemmatimonadales bacterium]
MRLPRGGVITGAGLALLVGPAGAFAQQRIADNSFLLEEAYNQEAGVVQHISTFARTRDGAWGYSLTSEWPLRSQRHQLSYTVPFQRGGGTAGFGDLALTYRWQAAGSETSPVWLAPRFTVTLPVGSAPAGRGAGGPGFEAALPVSIAWNSWLTTHLNAALLVNPGAAGRDHPGVPTRIARLGGSVVADLSPTVNLLVETLWATGHETDGLGSALATDHWVVSPGIRWAHDVGAVQVVPGLAYTFDLDPAGDQDAVFLYLSFEYRFRR